MSQILIQCSLSLLTGLFTGIAFASVKLPVPAPNLIGIFGILGITLGYMLYNFLIK